MAVAAIKSPDVEELTAFLEYLELNEDIQKKLNKVLAQIDEAKGYVGELRTSAAVLNASIEDMQEKLRKCATL